MEDLVKERGTNLSVPSKHLQLHWSRSDKEPRNHRHRISPGEVLGERFRARFDELPVPLQIERARTFSIPLQTCTPSVLQSAEQHNDLKVAVVELRRSVALSSNAKVDRGTGVTERKSFQNSPLS